MSTPKSFWETVILACLAVTGFISVFIAKDMTATLILMVLAYFSNASYSMVSRSAVRDSILYHAFTTLLSNLVFYMVLKQLVTDNMTLALFIPYTVATVYGSFTGAKASQRVEEYFGITTDMSKKERTPQSILAQKLLLGFLTVLGIIVGIYSDNMMTTLVVASLAFGDNVTFSLLRRSRNTSNTTYHIFASIVKSLAWYLLFQSLSLRGMPFALFIPYSFGSVLGGIAGQEVSAWIEKKIGATADAHLSTNLSWYKLVSWKPIIILMCIMIPIVLLSEQRTFLAFLAVLSAAQQVSFSIVSRSRQRNNMTYHIIASIFSNSIWFLTFRELQVKKWTNELFIPYAVGGAVGSVTGVGFSMGIEKAIGASSDSHVKQVPVANKS
ncbi:MAG: hypothetical protein WCW78_03735 [Candidatus Paceibacterota bacterium]|jgi:hypothetical protein